MERKDNIISSETYDYYMSNVGRLGYENVLEKLKGKSLEDEYKRIDDCGVSFVRGLLDRDWGRTIVYTYNEMELDFIKSKYLSDYFKDSIRELLNGTMTKEIEDILNSGKTINQMSEEEIKMVYDAVVEYYHINRRSPKPNISSRFLTYLYKLDGKCISVFIKNNIDGESIARQILLTSGLNDRASYYSGRGVNYSDLNENNLVAIFKKLVRIDERYGLNFVKMVQEMKTLGATEFINSFIRLGINKFEYNSKNITECNVSLDGVSGQARDTIAFMSIFSVMNGRDDEYQISETETMKSCFISKIRDILQIMLGEEFYNVIEEKYDDSFRRYRYRRR